MNTLLERLQTVEKRYEELTQILMDPSIANDIQKMTQASKEQASLEKAYNLYTEYKALLDGIEEAKELLNENGIIGVHPNDNTATIWLKTKDLIDLIKEHKNIVNIVEL